MVQDTDKATPGANTALSAEAVAGLEWLGRLAHQGARLFTDESGEASASDTTGGNATGGNTAGSAMLAGLATGAVETIGNLEARYDLPALAEELLGTLDALRRSGLLQRLRDNAAFINDSLDVITPLAGTLVQRLQALPLAQRQAELARLSQLWQRLLALEAFWREHLAGETVQRLIRLGEFFAEHEVEQTVGETLVLLQRLSDNGVLQQLGDLGDWFAGLEDSVNIEALLATWVQEGRKLPLARLRQLAQGVQQAMDAAHEDETRLGGMRGLMHLLGDREVQRGLRLLSTLPAYLEQQNGLDVSDSAGSASRH